MNRVRLQIFNHVSRNGHIYIADTKEDIENIFGKFRNEKNPLWLTDQLQGPDFDRKNMSIDEYRDEFATVDIARIAGIFEDIEIVETGDIGYNDKPIFEVYGYLKIINTDGGRHVGELLKENVCSIGMRSFSTKQNEKIYDIEHVVCFDLISGE